jgi:hypothetical protein
MREMTQAKNKKYHFLSVLIRVINSQKPRIVKRITQIWRVHEVAYNCPLESAIGHIFEEVELAEG